MEIVQKNIYTNRRITNINIKLGISILIGKLRDKADNFWEIITGAMIRG